MSDFTPVSRAVATPPGSSPGGTVLIAAVPGKIIRVKAFTISPLGVAGVDPPTILFRSNVNVISAQMVPGVYPYLEGGWFETVVGQPLACSTSDTTLSIQLIYELV